jgi:IS5 family transposase
VVQAWASLKSFQRKEDKRAKNENTDDTDPDSRNPDVNFKGEIRSNETHESTTDTDARLYRKGLNQGAQLAYLGHVMMENRNGLAVDHRLTEANGIAEREAALEMMMGLGEGSKTLGADKGYDTKDCVKTLRGLGVTPHLARNLKRRGGSTIDDRTVRHAGYATSQRVRKRVEEIFGWLKSVGPMRQTHFRGQARVAWMFTFALGVYNLVRMGNLCAE